MKITIGGRDRTEELCREITNQAETLYNSELIRLLEGEKDLVAIGQTQKDGDSYLGEFIRLLRFRNTIDYGEMEIPTSRRIVFLRFIKKMLWRLASPFHYWFAFRQNAINRALLYAIEFEREERRKEIARLKEELINRIEKNKQNE